ncbi:MAG: hypothetical protein KTR30_16075, partial [Saprospiraceae bacterium]|nr:hypothetical protein [Saprospiraceae bacterium]
WEDYLNLLSDDYVFCLPDSKLEIPASSIDRLNLCRIGEEYAHLVEIYDRSPDRICIGAQTVVFEFIIKKVRMQTCAAVSLDVLSGKIEGCREYRCILSSFSLDQFPGHE